MTFAKTFSATGVAGLLCLALGSPAQAVTCEEFSAMSPDMQRGLLMGLDAGRAEHRAMARSDAMEDAGEGVVVTDDEEMEGGLSEHRERGMGVDDETFAQVVDDCRNGPDRDVTGVHPASAPKK